MTGARYGDAVVLAPSGRLDHETADAFRDALAPHLARCSEPGDRIVLDLSGIGYISSVGLRVLMMASKQVRAQGGRMVVAAMQPVVREIFEISRFTLVFESFDSVPAALAGVSPQAAAAFGARSA